MASGPQADLMLSRGAGTRKVFVKSFWLSGDGLNTIRLNPTGPVVENAVLKRLRDASAP